MRIASFCFGLLLVAAALAIAADPPAAVHPDTTGWESLFADPALADAVCPPNVWKVEDGVLTAAEDKGGYAKDMGKDFYRRQQELMADVLAQHNVVITTAAVPGKKAPILVTREMVSRMAPGSIVVDIAAERGGNCELTRAGEMVEAGGVRIFGPLNLPSAIPYHASQLYARNIANVLKYLVKDGQLNLNREDEIVRETLVTFQGEVVHPRVREQMGLPPA